MIAATRQHSAQPPATPPEPPPDGSVSGIEDVPDISAEWYLDVAEFADATPLWLQGFAALFTEAVIVVFGVLLLASWWRARNHDARTMTRSLVGPVAVVVAYLVSEFTKTLVEASRPCRTFPAAAGPVVECPALTDWSFPSNHSTIAGAAALAVLLAWPRMGWFSVPLAGLAASSRVFVGVHYPHDVIVGLLLGATVATVLVLAMTPLVSPLVERLRERGPLVPLLTANVERRDSLR